VVSGTHHVDHAAREGGLAVRGHVLRRAVRVGEAAVLAVEGCVVQQRAEVTLFSLASDTYVSTLPWLLPSQLSLDHVGSICTSHADVVESLNCDSGTSMYPWPWTRATCAVTASAAATMEKRVDTILK